MKKYSLTAVGLIATLIFVFALLARGTARPEKLNQGRQTYASSEPLNTPKLFAEGIVNTEADEYGPAFTPDGQTLYFAKRVNRRDSEFINVSRFENGRWTEPKIADFSGQYFDKEPFITPDGARLFFSSRRPETGTTPKPARDFDLWYVERTDGGGWSAPRHLGAEVNSPNYENYPAVAADGTLYFSSVRAGGRGANDLYRSRLVNGKYQPAENLTELNTPYSDADPYIAPDQSYIIICYAGPDAYGEGDLYISFNQNGHWSRPRNLGAQLNTAEYEYTPLVSPDGKYLFFSRGWGEIYQVDLGVLNLAALRQVAARELDPKTPAALPSAERIVDQYVQALGGAKALEKLTTRVMTGTIQLGDKSGTFEVYAKAPNKQRRSGNITGVGPMTEIFNGTSGWVGDPRGGSNEAAGDMLGLMRRESEFHWELKLRALYPKMTLRGTSSVRGREAYVVEATAVDDSRTTFYFDVESGLLLMKNFELETSEGRVPFAFLYEDYRTVDGVKLPFTIRRASPHQWTIKFTEVKHNTPLDDATFEKPVK
jgi:hypothetical protein